MIRANGSVPPAAAAVTGLVAHAGGGQAAATVLTAGYNQVATVATIADSVQLPPALQGVGVFVKNSAAAAMQVFGANGLTDTIDGTAGATGVSIAAGKGATFYCLANGVWFSQMGA